MFKSRLNVKPVVVSFFGKMGSGKDTAGEIARKYFGFERMAFGDELKRIVNEKYSSLIQSLPPEEQPAARRRILQEEGQLSRGIYRDVWVDLFDKRLSIKYNAYESFRQVYNQFAKEKVDDRLKIVVTDMRQENEYEYLKNLGAIMIKIEVDDKIRTGRIKERDGYTPGVEMLNHETERHVDHFDYDYVIKNNCSKNDLTEQIYQILKEYA
jgi:dephospho-CoA kinase